MICELSHPFLVRQRKGSTPPRAFTLIEVIIAVTIITIISVALYGLTFLTIRLHQENVTRVQALELAREAVELVRNLRDGNWRNNRAYLSGSDPATNLSPGRYRLEFDPNVAQQVLLQPVTTTDEAELQLNQTTDGDLRRLTSGDTIAQRSPFYRIVEILPLPEVTGSVRGQQIRIEVFWYEGGSRKKTEIQTILTDWRKI